MDWFYIENGQQYGPVDEAQIRQLMASGRIDPQTLVWREGFAQWIPLQQTELGQQGAAPPPPPPPFVSPVGPVPYATVAAPIPNYLVQAILVTLCCCLPFGIVAIVYAAQVNPKQAAGDVAAAKSASDSARMWCWISFGIGLAFSLLYGLGGAITA